jgi:dUTPase
MTTFYKQALSRHARVMYLKMFIDTSDVELKNYYITAVKAHNEKMINNIFPDAGFDLFLPSTVSCRPTTANKIDFLVKCSAYISYETGITQNSGFYMYPRSSLSKTSLRLANSVGIIDSGYRGHLIGVFDCIDNDNTNSQSFKKYDKLVQICSPGLIPLIIELVNTTDALGENTERGEGGFGSTT